MYTGVYYYDYGYENHDCIIMFTWTNAMSGLRAVFSSSRLVTR